MLCRTTFRTTLNGKVLYRGIVQSTGISPDTPEWKIPELNIPSLHLESVNDLKTASPIKLHTVQFKGRKSPKNHTPILFLHGMFGSSQNYRSVGRTLSDQLETPVYAMDLRCHGSSPHVNPMNYTEMTNDVIHTVRQNGWDGCHIIGHSMGAKVAMLAALEEPELVKKLVVIDNAPVKSELHESFHRELVGLCHLDTNPELHKYTNISHLYKAADKLLLKFEPSSMVRAFLLGNLRIEKHHSIFRVPVLNFLKDDVIKEMGNWPVIDKTFNGPTLVMRANRSTFISENNLKNEFPQYFSDIKVEEFDAGHWLVSDNPKQFIESVSKFLQ